MSSKIDAPVISCPSEKFYIYLEALSSIIKPRWTRLLSVNGGGKIWVSNNHGILARLGESEIWVMNQFLSLPTHDITSLGLSFPTCKMKDSIRMISNFFSRSNFHNNHPTMSWSKQGSKNLNCNSRRWPSFEEGASSVNHPFLYLLVIPLRAAAAGRVPWCKVNSCLCVYISWNVCASGGKTGSHSHLCRSPVPSNMPGKDRHSIHVGRKAFNWERASLGRDVNKSCWGEALQRLLS